MPVRDVFEDCEAVLLPSLFLKHVVESLQLLKGVVCENELQLWYVSHSFWHSANVRVPMTKSFRSSLQTAGDSSVYVIALHHPLGMESFTKSV